MPRPQESGGDRSTGQPCCVQQNAGTAREPSIHVRPGEFPCLDRGDFLMGGVIWTCAILGLGDPRSLESLSPNLGHLQAYGQKGTSAIYFTRVYNGVPSLPTRSRTEELED